MLQAAGHDAVHVREPHFDRARQVERGLADAGPKGRKVPDLLNAVVAEAESRTVLHYEVVTERGLRPRVAQRVLADAIEL